MSATPDGGRASRQVAAADGDLTQVAEALVGGEETLLNVDGLGGPVLLGQDISQAQRRADGPMVQLAIPTLQGRFGMPGLGELLVRVGVDGLADAHGFRSD